MRIATWAVATALAIGLLAQRGLGGVAAPVEATPPTAYLPHAKLVQRVQALAAKHAERCTVTIIGTSREGRAIPALTLAMPGYVDPDRRPALLIAANIDGDHVVGSAVALELAAMLVEESQAAGDDDGALLRDHTVYIVPRVNPDAAERFFTPDTGMARRRNLRPDDADRDGAIDEDPPDDLNGDGLVTMMRVLDPEKATHMPDPDDPRLSVAADRDKGQRALFALMIEGADDDGDGVMNEDDHGGVDLNRNFMHRFKEHDDGVGPYQVSEPESLALLEFVLAHQNIAAVITYGRHDNLVKTPDGKGTDNAGTPKNIDEKDVGVYTYVGERFRDLTGIGATPAEATDGAFFAWAYAQFGVPSFTTPLWSRPEPEEEPEEAVATETDANAETVDPGEDGGGTPSGVGDIAQETLDELRAAAEASGMEVTDDMVAQLTPTMVEGFAKRMGVTVRRVKQAKDKKKRGSGEEAAWLGYSDTLGASGGFVDWTPHEHPDLGPVEIGGWKPYFRVNPPPEHIQDIAAKQLTFALELGAMLPDVSLDTPKVKRLASGVYEITTSLINDGYLPTGTAMAVRNRRARPHVVRLDLPLEQILTGQRVQRFWSVPGSGGRKALRWIVEAPDGERVTVTVYSEKYGQFEVPVVLEPKDGGGS